MSYLKMTVASMLIFLSAFLNIKQLYSQNIYNFTSLEPLSQDSKLHLPTGFTFQYIMETGVPLSQGGYMGEKNDFSAFVPIAGSSTNGYLSVNQESNPGGVTVLDINYNSSLKQWKHTFSEAIDFSSVAGTRNNCSGAITPWNTIITCEEVTSGDLNGDTFKDFGWAIEIDPATKKVIDQIGGFAGADKLWALGNFNHENAVVHENERTIYQGADSSIGYLFKFVAGSAQKLQTGDLYVYKGSKNGSGNWILLDNNTNTEQNSTLTQCANVGATVFNKIEDVEISPLDSMVYVAVANEKTVYRFKDDDPLNGTTVSNFETYVGGDGISYDIQHSNGTTSQSWGFGNDNLAFDNIGNLWVQQDGGDNHIWVVDTCHTQATPCVRIFARTPFGSESTGLTFTPDNKFAFLSIQHPSFLNDSSSQIDALGVSRYFHKCVSIVIALEADLGNATNSPIDLNLDEYGISSGIYCAENTIESNSKSGSAAKIIFEAANSILLKSDFEIEAGTEFEIKISN